MSFIISFGVSTFLCLIIVATQRIHGSTTLDSDMVGTRRFHKVPAPRIGGICVLIGIAAGGAYHGLQADNVLFLFKWAGIAAIPVFLGGFLEDLSKSVTPRDRLLLAFLSAAIAYYELGVGLDRLGWLWFDDHILTYPGISLALTLFMAAGVAHAANIIDGFHGLLIGFSIIALSAFCYIAYIENLDTLVIYISIVIGALLGIFLWNFPTGKIFLGDGGAYLIGFVLAIVALLLVKRSANVSPWFPLAVLIYPVFETIFSIYRKGLLRGLPVTDPDGIHMHMLIYGRVIRHFGSSKVLSRNPKTSLLMWLLSTISILPAVIWWNNTPMLALCVILWSLAYIVLYFKIVRFKLVRTTNATHVC